MNCKILLGNEPGICSLKNMDTNTNNSTENFSTVDVI